MRIDVGRVGDVIAGAFQPSHEVRLPFEELARAQPRVGPIEGNLDSLRAATNSGRSVAVVVIEAFASCTIVRIIVVGLVSGHALLIEQRRRAVIIAHDEDNVILVGLSIGEDRKIDAAGPGCGHAQDVTRRPVASDQSSCCIHRAARLLCTIEWPNVLQQTATKTLIPSDTINIDGEGLCRVDGDIESDRRSLVHARRRSIPFDLSLRVRDPRCKLPTARTSLLVLDNNRIISGISQPGRVSPRKQSYRNEG